MYGSAIHPGPTNTTSFAADIATGAPGGGEGGEEEREE